MAKRRNKLSSGPIWFDPQNYGFIDCISDIDLILETYIRSILWGDWRFKYVAEAWQAWDEIQINGQAINDKNRDGWLSILDSRRWVADFSKCPDETVFDSAPSIYPISIDEAHYYATNVIREHPIADWGSYHGESVKNSEYSRGSSLSAFDWSDGIFDSLVYAGIDLEFDDEVIVADMRKLLKSWRKQKHDLCLFSETPVNPKQATIRKVRDYRILPLLDLLIWQKLEKQNIASKVLEELLFPREIFRHGFAEAGLTNANAMQTTIIPLAHKCMDEVFLKSLLRHSRKKGRETDKKKR